MSSLVLSLTSWVDLSKLAHLPELPQSPPLLNVHNQSAYTTGHAQEDSGENRHEAVSTELCKCWPLFSSTATTILQCLAHVRCIQSNQSDCHSPLADEKTEAYR